MPSPTRHAIPIHSHIEHRRTHTHTTPSTGWNGSGNKVCRFVAKIEIACKWRKCFEYRSKTMQATPNNSMPVFRIFLSAAKPVSVHSTSLCVQSGIGNVGVFSRMQERMILRMRRHAEYLPSCVLCSYRKGVGCRRHNGMVWLLFDRMQPRPITVIRWYSQIADIDDASLNAAASVLFDTKITQVEWCWQLPTLLTYIQRTQICTLCAV